MIDAFLENLGNIIENGSVVAPLLALLAGVLTSFLPCSLSTIPLIVGYLGSEKEHSTKTAFKISLVFALGSALTYAGLGITASLVGNFLNFGGRLWYLVLGVLMLLMALQTFEVINIVPSSNLTSKSTKKGYVGAFFTGTLAGLFSSPCSTPVLIVLLAIVAGSGNLLYGILLFLMYSIGHSVLAVLSGTGVGFVNNLKKSPKYKTFNIILKWTLGILILLLGLYMLYLAF